MRMVPRSEAEAFFRRLGIGPSGPIGGTNRRLKSEEFYYRSRLATAAKVASLLVEAIGNYDEAMVWPHFVVFGDRTHDEEAPPDWVAYRKWRGVRFTMLPATCLSPTSAATSSDF